MSASVLAIHGGEPLLPEGPPSWPPQDAAVVEALAQMAADGSWGQYHGPHVAQLSERLSAEHSGFSALPCCSGTIAVELALRGLQLGPGDEVLLAGYDFPGNFRSIEAVGAHPVLVDIEPQSWSLDGRLIEAAVSPATRAVIVSHLHGGLANMKEVVAVCRRLELRIIEDACQSPGAWLDGAPAGCHGDVGILSFGGSKLLSAGRGGAILSPHDDVMQRIRVFAERGNEAFALSELQACVLLPQLDALPQRNRQRSGAATRLQQGLAEIERLVPVKIPRHEDEERRGSFYKLAWRLVESEGGASREDFLAAVQAEGVALHAGFRGFTRRRGRRCRHAGPLDNSQRAAEQTVILHHPVLLENEEVLERVIGAIRRVVHVLDGGV